MSIGKRLAACGIVAFSVMGVSGAAWAAPGDRSEDGAWLALAGPPAGHAEREPWVRPRAFAAFQLDVPALRRTLAAAPMEDTPEAVANPLRLQVPMPSGGFEWFSVVESPVMHPDLQARYPNIRTYLGRGLDDRWATIRLDLTPAGFHSQIITPEGRFFVDPYTRGDPTIYAAYDTRFAIRPDGWECLTPHEPHAKDPSQVLRERARQGGIDNPPGDVRRRYRAAIAATAEFTAFHSNPEPANVTTGLAAIVTIVNRATQVYENELAIRFELVPNNNVIVYTNHITDPYTNGNLNRMLNENQANLDAVIGLVNYDIGHVFGTGGGGLAGLGVVCRGGSEARGATTLPEPIGEVFAVDYFCHEAGHQFNARHSFNGLNGACGGNWSEPTAYEPGSGSTIMGYTGICQADDLQVNSDPVFNAGAFDEIYEYVTRPFGGGGCAITTQTGNLQPVVTAGADRTIPRSTPYRLTAQGSDGNGDPLVWTWEQRDLGPQAALSDPDSGAGPLVRVWAPIVSNTRIIPRLAELVQGFAPLGEQLPTTNRTMTFRATARDNRMGGGSQGFDEMTITVVRDAGPFRVTFPNTNVTWPQNTEQTVQWDVANTNVAPVNTSLVRITLSIDGGLTYPYVLLANTPNDGIHRVRVPDVQTTRARVRVEAIGSIYFDISDRDFTIKCYADCDGSTGPNSLDVFDFLCFLNAYNSGLPFACDCDGSTGAGVCDIFDFLCFQTYYAAGCSQ